MTVSISRLQAEIEMVLNLGASRDDVIYAHPCKPPAHIKYAAANGINLTTFDTVSELQKLAHWHHDSGAPTTLCFCFACKPG